MKLKLMILIQCLLIFKIFSQNLEYYTSGNGYNFEIAIAIQALDCISQHCIDGLKRTKFVDSNTRYDERLVNEFVSELNSRIDAGFTLTDQPFRYEVETEPLSFYRTFYDKSSGEILFQLELILGYQSGLLRADTIEVRSKDFVLTKSAKLYDITDEDYQRDTNIPYPPQANEIEVIYKTRGAKLCGDCKQKKIITVDQKRNFWLKEKYKYDHLYLHNNGLIMAKTNNFQGIIDADNKELIPLIFDKIESISTGHFKVYKSGKEGIYSISGNSVLPTEYEKIDIKRIYRTQNFAETRFIVKKNGLVGVMAEDGREIISLEYDEIELFYSNYFLVKKGKYYGLISKDGNLVLDISYQDINFTNGLAFTLEVIDKGGKNRTLFIKNEKGKKIIKEVKIR